MERQDLQAAGRILGSEGGLELPVLEAHDALAGARQQDPVLVQQAVDGREPDLVGGVVEGQEPPAGVEFGQALVGADPDPSALEGQALDLGLGQFRGTGPELAAGSEPEKPLEGADPGAALAVVLEHPDVRGGQAVAAAPVLGHAPAGLPQEHPVVAAQEQASAGPFLEAGDRPQAQVGAGGGVPDQAVQPGERLGPEMVAVGADPEAAVAVPDGAGDGIPAEQVAGGQDPGGAVGLPQVEAVGPERHQHAAGPVEGEPGQEDVAGHFRQVRQGPGGAPLEPEHALGLQGPELAAGVGAEPDYGVFLGRRGQVAGFQADPVPARQGPPP